MAEVVVTGASRGIGHELAMQLSARGDRVIAPVRHPVPSLQQPSIIVHEKFDIAEDRAVANFAQSLEGRPIDILINNAAIYIPDDWRKIDLDRTRQHFEINALGPVKLTRALLPNFRRGSKIAMISSRSGSIGLASDDENLSYRLSKAALNMASKVLSNGLRSEGIVVVAIHPGSVATRMNETGELSAEEAARRIISILDRVTVEEAGTYWHVDGYQLPW
jgi:NAD(P)-dependent dehydrogenase (short-subunit alcohol dehydrogenase family)